MEIGLSKGPGRLLRSPTVVKRAIGHWIARGKKCRRIVIHHRHTNFVQLQSNFAKPLVTARVTGRSFMRSIDISAAPESFFFGSNGIDNHAADGLSIRRVEPTDQ